MISFSPLPLVSRLTAPIVFPATDALWTGFVASELRTGGYGEATFSHRRRRNPHCRLFLLHTHPQWSVLQTAAQARALNGRGRRYLD